MSAIPPAPPPLTPLQRAFTALEDTRARLAAVEGAMREPIAIIGLGCRVPGGGVDVDSFWRLMRDGVDGIGPIPADRWDAEALYDPDAAAPGRIATRAGGFLGTIDGFDAGFFGISPREAQGMDPQQRLLLEVAWEALEHAGQAPDRLEHSATGVFVGQCSSDYAYMQLMSGDRALLDAHFTSGIAHSIVSGRVSYLLGLQGPSVTIDTACSSSLVAVHLACQSLRSGESRMALAGGVNLILSPDLYIALSHSRMLAPDGRCKTFDAAADGFARGEGCGMVVLKRLSDAQADGDRVLAVIRGSAVNQDGPSSGLTAPNGPAQEAVVRQALKGAGLAPRQVGVVEAHGTGTQLGDPLEVHALGAVFGADRAAAPPLLVGSVKTNIGHLEAAAGVTGLIKLVLALRHRTIPAHLHFHTPSPHIAWGDLPLQVASQAQPWAPIDGRRIGGVSSFGFSGTNAHVIVEEAPPVGVATMTAPPRTAWLLALSARDEAALAQLAARHATAVATLADDVLADYCHTANAGRAHFAQRATLLVSTADALRAGLAALAEGRDHDGLRRARVVGRESPRIAFVFTGQGAQYAGMARGLYDAAPVFRAALDQCAELLRDTLMRPLLDLMFDPDAGSTALDETANTQPALFALEYALAQLWRSWGVTPNVVMGHSVGELVAACIAGVWTLPDALALVAERGRLMQSLPAGGAMAAVFAPESQVAAALAPHASRVSIAAVNGPAQTVISGAADGVAAVCATFTAAGVRCAPLPVSHAFHSPLVDPVLDDFERAVAARPFAPPQLRLVSNVSGRIADASELTSAAYWRRHVRGTVRFADGLQALAAQRPDLIVEIGPHPTLLAFVGATLGADAPTAVASLRRGRDDRAEMLQSLATLYLAGVTVDWRGVEQGCGRRIVDAPTYPFQRERHWFHAAPAPASRPPGRDTGHPMLGTRLRSAGAEAVFESRVTADAPAFVRQHVVQGRVIVPAAAYLDTLLAAAQQLFTSDAVHVADVTIRQALLLPDDGAPRAVQLVAGPEHDGGRAVAISSAADGDDAWLGHVTAQLRRGAAVTEASGRLDAARRACLGAVASETFYQDFQRRGLDFGSAFRSLRQLWRGDGQALGEVELESGLRPEVSAWGMHPVLLDGCLQVLSAALADDADGQLYLPVGIASMTLHRRGATRCIGHATLRAGGGRSRRADVVVFDIDGAVLAELVDVQLQPVSRDALARLGERWLDDALVEVVWREATRGEASAPVPAVASLAAIGDHAVADLRRGAGLDSYDAFLPQLEALCADYVVLAMQRLGWAPQTGEVVQAAPLAARLGVQARHRRLFGRLLDILAEIGHLTRDAAGFAVTRPWPAVDPEPAVVRLRAQFPAAAAELELTQRVASELAEALRGERDPAALLFPGGSLETAERLYRDSPTAKFYNGLVAEVLTAAVTTGRTVRVLELGAGTGGTTAHVLPRLPVGGVEYTYTDVGPLFVAKARARFAAHAGMRYAVLDLERDVVAQGFAPGSFDVVIAANVIHATADLRRTLGQVRQLLAPGGLLAMLEVTAPQRWFDLTVGLTDGWWAFTDSDLRRDYATLSRSAWLQLLGECGFASAEALPRGDGHAGALGLQSLLLACARVVDVGARHWLLVGDGPLADALCAAWQARGDQCTRVPDHAAASAEAWRRLVAPDQGGGRRLHGVVHVAAALAAGARTAQEQYTAASEGAVAVTAMVQALILAADPPPLWLLTRGGQQADAADLGLDPTQSPLWGLARALAHEHPELRVTCVDLDPAAPQDELASLLAELDATTSDEPQVALRHGGRRVARLSVLRRQASPVARPSAWRLEPAERHAIDSLQAQAAARRLPGPGEVEIAVEATGLNFKDVLNVLGMYPGDPGPLGGECAGRVVAVGAGVTHVRPGDAVLAVAGGSFASHVVARAELVQRRPPAMSAEEGAAFPIAYLTAEFCLGHLAGLQRGEKVLVHAAAGGVGMAAVQLARRVGATVLATAGSPAKRALLRTLGVAHVFDSRSAGFADEVLAATGGTGVDVVLNSLSGNLIDSSFRATAPSGRFVEIGKRDIKSPEWVAALGRGLRYFVVDWGETAAREPELVGGMLARLVDEAGRGLLPALPRHTFALDEAARAFRFMAQARHHGKIVVRHGAAAPAGVRRDGSYLVTGGLSGLGPVLARWLVGQGAGRIVLVGRRGVTPTVAPLLDELRGQGCEVVAEALDVTDAPGLSALLARLRRSGPPLRGVIHSAGVLADAGVLQQDAQRYAQVFGPKVLGGALLDELTRPDALDFFVLFSSAAAVLGSAGQTNHSAANAYLDLLARERRSRGLPGLSINWGAWAEVGAAVDRGVAHRNAARGLGMFTPEQGLQALQRVLAQPQAQVAVLPADWGRYAEHAGRGATPVFLSELAGARPASAPAAAPPRQTNLQTQLAEAAPSRRRPVLAAFVRDKAGRALGLDAAGAIDPRTPLGELGLDSLLAVELRNTLGAALGRSLPATLLFDHPTIDALTDHLLAEIFTPAAESPTATVGKSVTTGSAVVDSIEDLSDEEVERQLAARTRAKA